MQYELIRSRRRSLSLEIRDGELLVRAPFGVKSEDIDAFVREKEGWIEKHLKKAREAEAQMKSIERLSYEELRELADRAVEVVPKRVTYYAPLIGVRPGKITIRAQRTRWGSCSSKGNLNFNCLLMLAAPEVLDSVVVHELCHLKVMNHSSDFYDEVLRVFPEYHTWDKWLRAHGAELMARLPA